MPAAVGRRDAGGMDTPTDTASDGTPNPQQVHEMIPPSFREYERLTTRIIPVVRLVEVR
jgi:hypothetical protein